MIITISGMPGSGKNTVAQMIADRLNFNHYSVGDLRGKMALERGMTLDELNKIGEKEAFTDKDADDYQKELGEKEDDFIIDGRLSWHFIPDSVKLYLDVSPEEGARRILNTKRPDEREYSSLDDALDALGQRVESDRKRYKKWYGVDCYDHRHYDFIVDTTNLSPEQVADKIIDYIQTKRGS